MLVVLTDTQAEQIADADARQLAHLGGERGLIVYGLDRGEPGLDRLGALRGDRGLVHETRVEIADLRAGLLLGRLQNAAGALERKILERVEHAVARTVGGDRRLRLPRAVAIAVENAARLPLLFQSGKAARW